MLVMVGLPCSINHYECRHESGFHHAKFLGMQKKKEMVASNPQDFFEHLRNACLELKRHVNLHFESLDHLGTLSISS